MKFYGLFNLTLKRYIHKHKNLLIFRCYNFDNLFTSFPIFKCRCFKAKKLYFYDVLLNPGFFKDFFSIIYLQLFGMKLFSVKETHFYFILF